MTTTSAGDSSSIFKDGRLKPGIYKIQNLYGETYVDIQEHSRDLCCRPATALGEGRGLWEIKPLGAGYPVRRVDPGKPEQFCVLLHGVGDGNHLSIGVNPYPMAWRIGIADNKGHIGFEYVRFNWETTEMAWDLCGRSNADGTKVLLVNDEVHETWRVWKLIPVKTEGAVTPSQSLSEVLGSGSPPSYNGGATGQSSTRTQHAESERDGFGTIVTEVTTITKRYRVEDA